MVVFISHSYDPASYFDLCCWTLLQTSWWNRISSVKPTLLRHVCGHVNGKRELNIFTFIHRQCWKSLHACVISQRSRDLIHSYMSPTDTAVRSHLLCPTWVEHNNEHLRATSHWSRGFMTGVAIQQIYIAYGFCTKTYFAVVASRTFRVGYICHPTLTHFYMWYF